MAEKKESAPRTPSPSAQSSRAGIQIQQDTDMHDGSTDAGSPATPASAVFSTSSHSASPVTPVDTYASPEERRSNSLAIEQVRLKSLQLRGQLDGATADESEAQILLFQCEGLFGELTIGDTIGEGQWSKVHEAWVGKSKAAAAYAEHSAQDQELYAAKVAAGKPAVKIIRHEARMLSYLTLKPRSKSHILGFYGYDMRLNALILEYLASPKGMTLLSGINENPSALPSVAKSLVEGLDFLHAESVIHGDIKPDNIFLRLVTSPREDKIIWQPVYCDFSASCFDLLGSTPTESAGTYDYMAPELFSTSAKGSFPTKHGDVYALGMTLVVAAAGCSPYAAASNPYAQRAMAMQGTPLDFMSTDLRAWRAFEASGLRRLVQGSLAKQPQARWTARDWADRMHAASLGLGQP